MKKYFLIALLILAITGCMPYSNPVPIKFECALENKEFFEKVSEILATKGFEIQNQTNSSIMGLIVDPIFLAQCNIYMNIQKTGNNVTINVRNEVNSMGAKSTAYYNEEKGPSDYQKLFVPAIQEIRNICK